MKWEYVIVVITINMRILVVIVTGIVVILGMVVEANAMRGVTAEYMRRRWIQGQSASVKIHHEIPAGVHAEYIRRRQVERQQVAAKIHARQPTLHIRQHLRQSSRGSYTYLNMLQRKNKKSKTKRLRR